MGKRAEVWWSETKRCEHAQEENDVSSGPQENRSRTKSKMGEGEGCREVGLTAMVALTAPMTRFDAGGSPAWFWRPDTPQRISKRAAEGSSLACAD